MLEASPGLRSRGVADHHATAGPQRSTRHPTELAVALLRQVVREVEHRDHIEAVAIAEAELEHVALAERDALGVTLLSHYLAADRRARRKVEHGCRELRVAVAHRHENAPWPPATCTMRLGCRRRRAPRRLALGARDLEKPADVGPPALTVVAEILVHGICARSGSPGSSSSTCQEGPLIATGTGPPAVSTRLRPPRFASSSAASAARKSSA